MNKNILYAAGAALALVAGGYGLKMLYMAPPRTPPSQVQKVTAPRAPQGQAQQAPPRGAERLQKIVEAPAPKVSPKIDVASPSAPRLPAQRTPVSDAKGLQEIVRSSSSALSPEAYTAFAEGINRLAQEGKEPFQGYIKVALTFPTTAKQFWGGYPRTRIRIPFKDMNAVFGDPEVIKALGRDYRLDLVRQTVPDKDVDSGVYNKNNFNPMWVTLTEKLPAVKEAVLKRFRELGYTHFRGVDIQEGSEALNGSYKDPELGLFHIGFGAK